MHEPVLIRLQDNIAQRIKEIAREHEVPLIENRPLARALNAHLAETMRRKVDLLRRAAALATAAS